jgi:hypothetical protein
MANQARADDNGSVVMSSIGPNNQLLNDGSYTYLYDDEGNRSDRVQAVGMATDTYTWDHRNRLTKV